ncbi:MAG: cation-translocating P-type ATPase [Candidatus Aenigmarchaeota archaeon]|nr:cation-translocating P-type ATPase [Candidatus Aenigmarchaeota archaeon]
MEFYKSELTDVYKEMESSENGLSDSTATERLKKYGPNQIEGKKKTSAWVLLFAQFRSILIFILIAASVISFFLGDVLEASVILAIVILNGVLGFVQERKAEKSLEALKKMSAPNALVLRGNEMKKIPASELVLGDIIALNVGDKVPADCRIIEEMNLKADESILTGESAPVSKKISVISNDAPLSERYNMLFSGTTVVYGRCKAIVTGTGMKTEFGKIASALEGKDEKTPIEEKLGILGRQLGIMTIAICALVFALGLVSGGEPYLMFLTAVALAVAAIPEGLPTVVTITLAMGLQKMAKKNAIIRKLPAVETLGCATVICSDKTGTLTMNEMTVRKLYMNGNIIDVSGEGYGLSGDFSVNGAKIEPDNNLKMLLKIGQMCNDAYLDNKIGDPTEIALLVSASNSSVYEKGEIREMTISDRERMLGMNHEFASNALRVLGFAFSENETAEKNLVFVGLQGMIDPPRPEVRDAVEKCKSAGIRVVMITGDHRDTAVAVAKELKILDQENEGVLTGADLDAMQKEQFEANVEKISVYARVSPEHKVMITDALKKNGHIVAMTGDGVNDAPALKKADIGIAMGITGTDVSKEASDMVLTDDNFSSIVAAVEEGRGIYNNIRKFVYYLLACNIGEVIIITASILLGIFYPPLLLPLLPLQILWMNLLTDSLPALALGVELKDPDIMQKGPRNPKEKILTKNSVYFLLFISIMVAIGTLSLFYYNLDQGIDKARTVAFTVLVMSQLFIALSMRSEKLIAKIGLFSNKKLIMAILVSTLLQLVVIYLPVLSHAFGTVSLGLIDWTEILAVSVIIFVILEVKKLISSKTK